MASANDNRECPELFYSSSYKKLFYSYPKEYPLKKEMGTKSRKWYKCKMPDNTFKWGNKVAKEAPVDSENNWVCLGPIVKCVYSDD